MIKPKLCLDFDGVIYSNQQFKRVDLLRDPPVKGALEAVKKLSKTYKIFIHSTRNNSPQGLQAVKEWIEANGLAPFVQVVDYKPIARMYIDDRAIQFRGDWTQTIKDIDSFRQYQDKDKDKLV